MKASGSGWRTTCIGISQALGRARILTHCPTFPARNHALFRCHRSAWHQRAAVRPSRHRRPPACARVGARRQRHRRDVHLQPLPVRQGGHRQDRARHARACHAWRRQRCHHEQRSRGLPRGFVRQHEGAVDEVRIPLPVSAGRVAGDREGVRRRLHAGFLRLRPRPEARLPRAPRQLGPVERSECAARALRRNGGSCAGVVARRRSSSRQSAARSSGSGADAPKVKETRAGRPAPRPAPRPSARDRCRRARRPLAPSAPRSPPARCVAAP